MFYFCKSLKTKNEKVMKEENLKNYKVYLEKLKTYGISTEEIDSTLGKELPTAGFSVYSDSKLNFEGSLISAILKLTAYAVKINNLLEEDLKINKESLVKVCLLQHLSKIKSIIPNPNQYEVDTRGKKFVYNNNIPNLKTGCFSLIMAEQYGCKFTLEEAEAITSIDRDEKDFTYHSSLFSTIVKQANELVYQTSKK